MASAAAAIADLVTRQLRADLLPDGGDAQLVEVKDDVIVLRYQKGHNDNCIECVMSPEDFRAFALDAFQRKLPQIRDVHLEPQ